MADRPELGKVLTMKMFRKRFGIRSVIAFVGLCALLFWAMRISRDSRPSYLYTHWLSERDDSRRLYATEELGRLGAEAAIAVPALTRAMLTESAAPIRKQSAVSLAGIVSKLKDGPTTATVAAAFVRALTDEDPSVREAASEGLGRISPDPKVVVPPLLKATRDGSEWVRGAAITSLGSIQKNAGIDLIDVRLAIIAAMVDESLHVREMGIYAFWKMAEKSPELSIALLKHDDVPTRRSVVTALARSSPLAAAVIPELAAALSDEDAAVRAGAARALGNIGPASRPAVPALMRAFSDPDRIVRQAAANALLEIDDGAAPSNPALPGR
jgi:HEAT repeat protein